MLMGTAFQHIKVKNRFTKCLHSLIMIKYRKVSAITEIFANADRGPLPVCACLTVRLVLYVLGKYEHFCSFQQQHKSHGGSQKLYPSPANLCFKNTPIL